MACHVYKCRFKFSHVTAGHRCGKCYQYGHGQGECGKSHLIQQLRLYLDDKMLASERCTAKRCCYRWSHSIEGHFCPQCKGRHSYEDCPSNPERKLIVTGLDFALDDCRKNMNDTPGKIWAISWAGMGCYICAKRELPGGKIESKLISDTKYDLQKKDVEIFTRGYTPILDQSTQLFLKPNDILNFFH